MKRLSIGAALGEAFELVGRRPLSVLVWGLLVLAPIVGLFVFMPSAMVEMMSGHPGPDADAAAEDLWAQAVLPQMMQAQAASMLANLGQLLAMVVVYGAIMRAVLRPEQRAGFSLRLGMDELRLAVVGIAVVVAIYAAVIVVALLTAALAAAFWGASQVVAVGIIGGAVVATVIGLFVFMARVSLIAPASLLYRDFAFVQGWRLARGHTLPLLGLLLLIVLIILAIEIAAVVVFGAVAFGAWRLGAVAGFEGVEAKASPDEGLAALCAWAAAHWPWLAVGGIGLTFIYGIVLVLSIAPYASACRQLARQDPVGPPISADTPVATD